MAIDIKPPPATVRPTGITELPANKQKFTGKPTLDENDLVQHIELLGARVAWSRAAFCPCQSANEQTKQPDPTCVKCQGRGFFYFGVPSYVIPDEVGDLTTIQKAIIDDEGAAVIRTLFTRSTHITDPYDLLGTWVRGSIFVTVRPENKIGYYDKLVNLDAEICYSEVVEINLADDPNLVSPIRFRYRATQVNTLETTTTRYRQNVDFDLTNDGNINWTADIPTPDTSIDSDNTKIKLSVHYLTHPAWLIVEYPHVFRETPARSKVKVKTTPFGTPTAHPIQALARLEFLPKTERDVKFT